MAPDPISDLERCKARWPILQRLPQELCEKIEYFMILRDEIGVLLITKSKNHNDMDNDNDDDDEKVYLFSGPKCLWSYPEDIVELHNKNVCDIRFGGQHFTTLTETGTVFLSTIKKYGQIGKKPAESKIDGTSVATVQIRCNHTDDVEKHVEFGTVRCGVGFTVGLTRDENDDDYNGRVYCWGKNESGQCGVGHNHTQRTPALVKDLKKLTITQIDCGDYHTLALSERGQVYSWGFNVNGQLGIGNHDDDEQTWPVMVIIDCCDSPVKRVVCGNEHSLLLTTEGRIYGFGLNSSGQIGCGPGPDQIFIPVPVVTPDRFQSIAAYGDLSLAKSNDGCCYVWGDVMGQQIGKPKLIDSRTLDDALHEISSINFTPSMVRIRPVRKPTSSSTEPSPTAQPSETTAIASNQKLRSSIIEQTSSIQNQSSSNIHE